MIITNIGKKKKIKHREFQLQKGSSTLEHHPATEEASVQCLHWGKKGGRLLVVCPFSTDPKISKTTGHFFFNLLISDLFFFFFFFCKINRIKVYCKFPQKYIWIWSLDTNLPTFIYKPIMGLFVGDWVTEIISSTTKMGWFYTIFKILEAPSLHANCIVHTLLQN